MEQMKKRVYCLYRVSTLGQVEKDDIPMQKQCCREFAERQGWEIIKEISEKGVSGFKVSVKNRDAVMEIQQDAALGKFDILLVYMFDRLGRKDDETPFVVEWFVRNGIEVWSTIEGQQRFDNHVDKLMNYIRYWQASGESIKTSIRTKTRLGQIVQEGRFRGGVVPYGYRLEKQGRMNKKNHEVNEIVVDEQEAAVVRLIFDKYVNEGFGAQRLSKYLWNEKILTRKGKNFTNTTLNHMIKNIMYLGILRSGESKSEILPELQIIDVDTFERAQKIMEARTLKHNDIPFNTKGKALLSGKAYCGHCGSKLVLTTSGGRPVSDGTRSVRIRYGCHNKVRHSQDCTGQSGYSTPKLDALVEKAVLILFSKIRAIPENELIFAQYQQQREVCSLRLKQANARYEEKSKELASYKAEVYKAIQETSALDKDILSELISDTKKALESIKQEMENAQTALQDCERMAAEIKQNYNRVISWAEMYNGSSFEAKKMILAQLIDRVTVWRGYKLEINFNVTYEEFGSVIIQEEQIPA